ncbi:hypothetical protein FDECE_12222 [Fusarium decemcellulare]|nr:hypothetical protein FDECE_12222 [Fusarium decemcellulare]
MVVCGTLVQPHVQQTYEAYKAVKDGHDLPQHSQLRSFYERAARHQLRRLMKAARVSRAEDSDEEESRNSENLEEEPFHASEYDERNDAHEGEQQDERGDGLNDEEADTVTSQVPLQTTAPTPIPVWPQTTVRSVPTTIPIRSQTPMSASIGNPMSFQEAQIQSFKDKIGELTHL